MKFWSNRTKRTSFTLKIRNCSKIDYFLEPRVSLPPLLLKLSERRPENLDYIGVSFGVTEPLLKFYKRANFIPVYLRLK